MYLSQSEFTARSGELKRLTANLQSVPERILQVLSTFGREMEAIYRLESDLKAEAIRTRLLDAQQRAEQQLNATRNEVEPAKERATRLANELAVSITLPEEPLEGLFTLTRFQEAQARLRVLADFTSDEALSASLRALRKVLERDEVVTLAAWCHLADWLDAHPAWKLAESQWRQLQELLPPAYRERIQQAQVIAEGTVRVQQALTAGFRYVRASAQERVLVPRWNGELVTVDGIRRK